MDQITQTHMQFEYPWIYNIDRNYFGSGSELLMDNGYQNPTLAVIYLALCSPDKESGKLIIS